MFRGDDYDAMDDAIAGLQAKGPSVFPALVAALSDPQPMVRSQCAATLKLLGPPPEALNPLIQMLSDPDTDNRWNAARALGSMGTGATAAISELEIRAAEDAQAAVRDAASNALTEIR